MPVWLWILAGAAVLWVVFVVVFAPFKHGSHEARLGCDHTSWGWCDGCGTWIDPPAATVPVATVEGAPPWAWAAPAADRVTTYGYESGSMGAEYGQGEAVWMSDLPPEQEAKLRAALLLPYDPPGEDGTAAPPSAVPGAGDESEASGPPAPPAPPDPRHLAETWLDAQLADLFTWVRATHAMLETL